MQSDDLVRIKHMLDAAREAQSFAEGRSRQELTGDRQLTLSLVKCVEIVGEAASRVSEDAKTELPSLPWLDIIGMRNRLIHAYYDVNLDILWDTVTSELPGLVAELEEAVEREEV